MRLRAHRFTGVGPFLEAAGDFLVAREAEHNLILGMCSVITTSPEVFADDPPRFLTVTDPDDRVVAASFRTPPYHQVLSEVDDPAAIDAMVDALVADPPPGVLGPTDATARFVARWADATGAMTHLEVSERIFRLDRVTSPPRPAPGTWRLAERRDRMLIAAWLVAFSDEAVPWSPPLRDPLETADRWIAGVSRQAYLWEDAGRAVSLVGASGATPNGIRIGPVYTPPAFRGRGYATSLTAAVSSDQLARGRRFCFLFTDLSNPTSNSIYQVIGYRPVRDVDQYRFEDPR